ncbi:MAG: hypothetical protein M1826_001011 [Phylliscum demangeonii]|nr:MAG: hypothetical protein M1826_001011 [Phylliscum demangeonii]
MLSPGLELDKVVNAPPALNPRSKMATPDVSGPSEEVLDQTTLKLTELMDAIQAHPQWQPPHNMHNKLYFIWDFIGRSRQMVIEVPQTQREKGADAANKQYNEAAQRLIFTRILMNDNSAKAAMVTMSDPARPVDFGPDVKRKMDEVDTAFSTAFSS